MKNIKKLKDCDYIETTERFLAYLMTEKEAPFGFLSDTLKVVEKWKKEINYKKNEN